MSDTWKDDLLKLLLHWMQCSVENRYSLMRSIGWSNNRLAAVDLQGSILQVKVSLADLFSRQGGYEEFVRALQVADKPDWYVP